MPKYRERLTPAESGLYDLMAKTSEILRQLADESTRDVYLALNLEREGEDGFDAEARTLQHDVVTYAFTLGVQFAVHRQQEVAAAMARQMGLIPKES